MLQVFLPPIGGLTIYIFGDPALIPDEDVPLTVRVHDECNGSDVFGRCVCAYHDECDTKTTLQCS